MKKLLIAGYADSTVNYQNAFARLGASCDTLPPKAPSPAPCQTKPAPPLSLPRLSYCPPGTSTNSWTASNFGHWIPSSGPKSPSSASAKDSRS